MEAHEELGGGAPPVDPFAEVPADGGGVPVEPGTLGGDNGEGLDELETGGAPIEPAPGEFLEEPTEDEIAGEVAAEAAASEPEPVPVAAEEPVPVAAEPEPEPEPQAAEPEPKSQPAKSEPAKKSGSSARHYAILMKNEETGEWSEPFAEEGGIEAANGEIALREAYNRLVPESSEDQIELVCFPTHYWKPRKVGAKAKVRRSVTID